MAQSYYLAYLLLLGGGGRGKTIYYLDFTAETYLAWTRKEVLRSRGTVPERNWNHVRNRLHSSIQKHSKAKFDEQKIRLMLEDSGKVRWYVDQRGNVLTTDGQKGVIAPKALAQLNRELLKCYRQK